MRGIFIISVFAVILAGCKDKVYDVEFYKNNRSSRVSKLEECKANREVMRDDQNCLNASEADFQEYLHLKGAKIEEAKKVIKSILKDPESAVFSDVRVVGKENTVCGKVNAKNSFGGYVGANLFFVAEGKAMLSTGDFYNENFDSEYRERCE